MRQTIKKRVHRQARHSRVRRKVRGTAQRPRLCVFKSNRYLYAQLIDDDSGRVLGYASSMSQKKGNLSAAKKVGEEIAEAGKKAGIERAVFDRGGYIYHGRIKTVADAARAKGLVI